MLFYAASPYHLKSTQYQPKSSFITEGNVLHSENQIITAVTSDSKFYLEFSYDPPSLLFQKQ